MSKHDAVLADMAKEMKDALVRAGLDPANPPKDSKPPAQPAFREYIRRGGHIYKNADVFASALVSAVSESER